MELIIKPTSQCNFGCAFCSAAKLNIPRHQTIPDVLRNEIYAMRPTGIIITGGESLLTPRPYLEELLALDWQPTISLTSNLMLWYNNPEKYEWLLSHPRVGIITSFQYGTGRRFADGTVYTEDKFRAVLDKFKARVGYTPDFIYVVTSENEQYVEKACKLADEYGIMVKFSNCLPQGASTEYYPQYKLLQLIIDLNKKGYRSASASLNDIKVRRCPWGTAPNSCRDIMACWVDAAGRLVKFACEEWAVIGQDMPHNIVPLFPECGICPLYSLCNGCSINNKFVKDIKKEHCAAMKSLEADLASFEII